jgi:hypothetical protein
MPFFRCDGLRSVLFRLPGGALPVAVVSMRLFASISHPRLKPRVAFSKQLT